MAPSVPSIDWIYVALDVPNIAMPVASDGAGNPTLGTSVFDGPSTTLHLHAHNGNAQVRALVYKPSATPSDSVIAYGSWQFYHVP